MKGAASEKILYVTPRLVEPPLGGRAQLSRLHRHALAVLYGPDLILHELQRGDGRRGNGLAGLTGHIDGISAASLRCVGERIRRLGIDRVFIDGSNLGALARMLRSNAPRVEVLTFFHNVEARFFFDALRETRRPKALAVLGANYVAERMAVRHSHRLVVLSRRDGDELRRLYGRGATDILPMAVQDELPPHRPAETGGRTGDYALFVGGAFFANVAGIRWFARKVAPRLGLRTCIVGRGLDLALRDLPPDPKVQVVGPVERLAEWYAEAAVVVAPIFGGSGMKTKVAEALMFGKHVLGTGEAFSGYEAVRDKAGWVCETPEEFTTVLRGIEAEAPPRFDPALRALYERCYSPAALTAQLAAMLGRGNPAPGPNKD